MKTGSDVPEALEKFSLVEKKLHNRIPFAHWAVFNSLQPRSDSSALSCVRPAEFIVDPLKELFANKNRGLSEILKQLDLLSVRFEQSYMREEKINWKKFQTDIPLVELLRNTSAHDIAHSITIKDTDALHRLSPRDVIEISNYIKQLDTQWKELCLETEVVIAEGTLDNAVVDLAMASDLIVATKFN
ncbi:MAG: hypothetical protein M1813_001790 [Trichoglossum hirsutum]|nr:MAG: hypothetical protein M1813_001790 [Trichoglossum hirsutum]